MRIIAGTARGRKLAAPEGEDTRPTLERVKEGMFSSVQFWLPGANVLDLYAGSGQLGLEAVSRGAKSCVFVEQGQKAAAAITQNINTLGFSEQCRTVRTTAEAFLANSRDKFDLIFADPPYQKGILPLLLKQAARVCTPGAIFIFEHEAELEIPQQADGFVLEKQHKYGTAGICRYKFREEE